MKAFVTAQLNKEKIEQVLSKHLTLTFGGWGYEGVKLTPEQLVKRAQDQEILIICYEEINEYVLTNLPKLKYIACSRGGIENIDLEAVKRHNIILSNTPGRNASAVADLTLGLMISVTRFIPQTYRLIMDRQWDKVPWDIAGNTPFKRFSGMELEGKTLGLIGYGAIGKKVAKRASGFEMKILVYDPYVKPDALDGMAELTTLDSLLSQADFVSLHCKLTKQTEGIINKDTLGLMKKSAFIINTARGRLVVEEDLYNCLKEKKIAGAALDALIEEPMNHDHPFLGLENLVITPHIGGASNDIINHQTSMIVEDILNFINGRNLVHAVV